MNNMFFNESDIVLVVDDTIANHEVIQAFLSDIGVKCESAFDGMEALTMCSSAGGSHYSLILMDINLPYMDGIETARNLRQTGVVSPIIAVTAASRDEQKIAKAEAEDIFDLILFKPFNAASFYTTISPYIKRAILRSLSSEIMPGDSGEFKAFSHDICDIHTAIDNMGGSPRLFMKHFNNFKSNNADLALRLTALVESRRYTDAAFLCHSIKGLAGMLGLTALYKHIIQLEDKLKTCSESPPENESEASFEHDCNEIFQVLLCISNDIRGICQLQF